MSNGFIADILLVEDNPGDVELTREALRLSKIANKLFVVTDGEEAMNFLHKEGSFRDAITPHLVLLDLNLPKKDGRAILKEVKEDPKLRLIPVVVLTTSSQEEDMIKAYEYHANCYVTKPLDFSKFYEIVQRLNEFWFSIVKIPGRDM